MIDAYVQLQRRVQVLFGVDEMETEREPSPEQKLWRHFLYRAILDATNDQHPQSKRADYNGGKRREQRLAIRWFREASTHVGGWGWTREILSLQDDVVRDIEAAVFTNAPIGRRFPTMKI